MKKLSEKLRARNEAPRKSKRVTKKICMKRKSTTTQFLFRTIYLRSDRNLFSIFKSSTTYATCYALLEK